MFRRFDDDGRLAGDLLTLAAAKPQGAALLLPVMRTGRLLAPAVVLDGVREYARTELTRLPDPLRALDDTDPYPVEIAPVLRELAAQMDAHT